MQTGLKACQNLRRRFSRQALPCDRRRPSLDGIKIKIRRDPEMLDPNFPFLGNTPDAKTIELYPKAFTNKDELIKTLGHERIHVYQRKVFGTLDSTQLLKMERAAELSEESWIRYARMKGVH
jgi:hypothetical protein